MSQRPDTDIGHDATEQTALLGDQRAEVGDDQSVHSHPEVATAERRPRSWYAWRIFWAVLFALVVGFFIKGWIDADETDVLC